MSELLVNPSYETLSENIGQLHENEYPGRLIAMGRGVGNILIQAYALTGRSPGSRDRIFVETEEGVKTLSPTKTAEEMALTPNADLIYYKAMRNSNDGLYVVSNGAQTDPVFDNVFREMDTEAAIKAAGVQGGIDLSRYEPDSPNFTPRITGVIDLTSPYIFDLSIVRKPKGSEHPHYRTWGTRDLSSLAECVGQVIHTYSGNGDPLPSFAESPYPIPFGPDAETTASILWEVLDEDNRVAVVATAINQDTMKIEDRVIINKHEWNYVN